MFNFYVTCVIGYTFAKSYYKEIKIWFRSSHDMDLGPLVNKESNERNRLRSFFVKSSYFNWLLFFVAETFFSMIPFVVLPHGLPCQDKSFLAKVVKRLLSIRRDENRHARSKKGNQNGHKCLSICPPRAPRLSYKFKWKSVRV